MILTKLLRCSSNPILLAVCLAVDPLVFATLRFCLAIFEFFLHLYVDQCCEKKKKIYKYTNTIGN